MELSTTTTEVWDEIKQCLKNHLSSAGYQTLITSAKPLTFDDNILVLEVLNMFSKEWMKDKCEPVIREHCPSMGYNVVIEYIIKESTSEKNDSIQLQMFQASKTTPKKTIMNY